MSNQKKKKSPLSLEIEKKLLPHDEGREAVPLSVILPVYNCSEAIGATLESLEKQNYESLEVIVIDAGSIDRTLEIVNSYSSMITRIYTVAGFNLTDMLNRGITLATSRYLTFLFPGTTYLSDTTFQFFSNSAYVHDFPDLLYCGSIQREVKREPVTIQHTFDLELIRQGKHPATLPASWFRQDLFNKIGKFDPQFSLRPGYEYFCRITCAEGIRTALIDRVFVDFDYGRFSYGKALRFATETWRILSKHFGFSTALAWFLSINHIAIIKGGWRRFKELIFNK